MSRYVLFGAELYALPILRPLQAALRARGDEVRWFLHGMQRDRLEADESSLDSVRAVREFAPAAVFSAANWVPDFFPGLKVQVFHGFNVEKRAQSHGHFRIRGLFDLYCTQGPATTAPFQDIQRRQPHFRVAETGWPKLDPLFGDDGGAAQALCPADGRPVVLFGSTFTERLSSAPHLHAEIARLIAGGEWYWLLTLHPKSDPALFERYRALQGANARFVDSDRIVPLLRAADVLVSDTSSIVSEFVVQEKPVVTFRNRVPRPHMLDIGEATELEGAIRHALARPADLMQRLRAYAAEIHPYRDGRSSERVIAATIASIERGPAGLTRKPLNLWRRLQMRQWLGYFRP
jgi:CDP-glycerol glycerophosphotransferase (TagB/SpsB family)